MQIAIEQERRRDTVQMGLVVEEPTATKKEKRRKGEFAERMFPTL